MEYAFDTNVVIHLMRGTQSVRENREKAQKSGARFIIPPFVNYEVRRGLIIKPIPTQNKAAPPPLFTLLASRKLLMREKSTRFKLAFPE